MATPILPTPASVEQPTEATVHHVEVCPMCGSPIVPRQYYVGGRGYLYFDICSGDASHDGKRN